MRTPNAIKEAKKRSIRFWIIGSMREQKISQKELSEALRIERHTFANRLSNMSFSYMDMVQIFTILHADSNTIAKYMTCEK